MNRHARQLFYFGWGGFAPIFNPLAQAVQILAKYGGSLWVASPDYTFTGSDGTGAAGDGSDAGYVLDLCGNARPMFQATTSFKPKLKRVPKKLGAELSSYASASLTAGSNFGSSIDVAVGKSYAVTASGTKDSGTSIDVGVVKGNYTWETSGLIRNVTANGAFSASAVVVPTTNAWRPAAIFNSATGTVTSVSVREVLEWTWAWVFDGVDDVLATVSQPVATEETLIVCKDSVRKTSGVGIYMSKRGGGFTGVWMYTDTNSDNGLASGNGTAWQYNVSTPPGNPTKLVMSAVTSATQVKKRTNAINTVNSVSYASGSGPVNLGGYAVAFANSTVFAAAYCPTALSDADLLIIEKAMAQLAGVTI